MCTSVYHVKVSCRPPRVGTARFPIPNITPSFTLRANRQGRIELSARESRAPTSSAELKESIQFNIFLSFQFKRKNSHRLGGVPGSEFAPEHEFEVCFDIWYGPEPYYTHSKLTQKQFPHCFEEYQALFQFFYARAASARLFSLRNVLRPPLSQQSWTPPYWRVICSDWGLISMGDGVQVPFSAELSPHVNHSSSVHSVRSSDCLVSHRLQGHKLNLRIEL